MRGDIESFVKGLKRSTDQHKPRLKTYGAKRYNEAIKKDVYFFLKKETGVEAKTPAEQKRVILETVKAKTKDEQHFLEWIPVVGQLLPFLFGNGDEAARAAAEAARQQAEAEQRRQMMYLIFGAIAVIVAVIILIKK